jgi:hypothetical protein
MGKNMTDAEKISLSSEPLARFVLDIVERTADTDHPMAPHETITAINPEIRKVSPEDIRRLITKVQAL